MSEFNLSHHKRALLFGQFTPPHIATTQAVDPFLGNQTADFKPPSPQINKLTIALAIVVVAHFGIWFIAKQLPTQALEIKKPEPVVIEIVKPEEPPKIIEPKIPPVTQKPKIPPVVEKPKPVQKPIEQPQPKPVQKQVEQAKPAERPTEKTVAQPALEPTVSKSVVTDSKPAEPAAKSTDDNLPVTDAKGYAGYLSNPAPDYPEQALERGWEGSVLLRVKVAPNGSPESVTIKQSSGKKVLDNEALRTVKGWKFSPALKGKTPVEGWVDVPLHFKLPK
ncbi:energy transducer TonB [Acinetobacter sp. ANC 4558]|uniref:energy transducer TonB n=1 Tax=Acinetobacter sp. ANC 4558 TaxID=1977876 RepID=UPI000A332AEE|nr:energy transducer TonB [Acinetobacter sp. ANC 4558]OTG84161.1 energy transducer TonB [Acinetobacter sp. ANC 4558]